MTTQLITAPATSETPTVPLSRFATITAAAAIIAVAAFASTIIAVPVWAMFMGWVDYYTRGHSARDGVANFISFALGLVFGMGAAFAVGALALSLGTFALCRWWSSSWLRLSFRSARCHPSTIFRAIS